MLTIASLTLSLACGGSTEPKHRAATLGRYAHTFQHPASPGDFAARSYTGTFTISAANTNAFTGTFAVTGYRTTAATAEWQSTAYRLEVPVSGGPLVFFRLLPTSSGLTCVDARATAIRPNGTVASVVGSCTFQYLGP